MKISENQSHISATSVWLHFLCLLLIVLQSVSCLLIGQGETVQEYLVFLFENINFACDNSIHRVVFEPTSRYKPFSIGRSLSSPSLSLYPPPSICLPISHPLFLRFSAPPSPCLSSCLSLSPPLFLSSSHSKMIQMSVKKSIYYLIYSLKLKLHSFPFWLTPICICIKWNDIGVHTICQTYAVRLLYGVRFNFSLLLLYPLSSLRHFTLLRAF